MKEDSAYFSDLLLSSLTEARPACLVRYRRKFSRLSLYSPLTFYPGTSLARPVIARAQMRVAQEEGCKHPIT